MGRSVANDAVRTLENPLRTDLSEVRAGSHMLRIAANSDRETLISLVREVMRETGTSQKELAKTVNVPESVISDALNVNGTRHLAAEWLLGQDDRFVGELLDRVRLARGLTQESRRAARAARAAELVRLIFEEGAA